MLQVAQALLQDKMSLHVIFFFLHGGSHLCVSFIMEVIVVCVLKNSVWRIEKRQSHSSILTLLTFRLPVVTRQVMWPSKLRGDAQSRQRVDPRWLLLACWMEGNHLLALKKKRKLTADICHHVTFCKIKFLWDFVLRKNCAQWISSHYGISIGQISACPARKALRKRKKKPEKAHKMYFMLYLTFTRTNLGLCWVFFLNLPLANGLLFW